MRKIIFIILLLPFLTNCSQYTAMVGPTFTLAKTGNVVQASTSLSSSYAANKIKDTYIGDLSVEKICPTVHSAEINQIFFETVEQMDCYYDPMSILG